MNLCSLWNLTISMRVVWHNKWMVVCARDDCNKVVYPQILRSWGKTNRSSCFTFSNLMDHLSFVVCVCVCVCVWEREKDREFPCFGMLDCVHMHVIKGLSTNLNELRRKPSHDSCSRHWMQEQENKSNSQSWGQRRITETFLPKQEQQQQ